MNNQTEIIKPATVSNDTDAAANVVSPEIPESVPAVTDKPKTATDQGDASNAQTDNSSDLEKQITPDVPTSVKLELSEEEADMIQTLLRDYVRAYRSDRSVDYKPELVQREKVGQYPWVATPPAPEIINPAYDWVNKKWYSKNASDSLPDLVQTVADLKAKNAQLYQDREKLDQDIKTVQEVQKATTQQSLALTQGLQNMVKSQEQTNKVMASMQQILLSLKAGQDQAATPTAPKTDATNGQAQDKNENGGN